MFYKEVRYLLLRKCRKFHFTTNRKIAIFQTAGMNLYATKYMTDAAGMT